VPITGVAPIAMPAIAQVLPPPPQYIVPVADPAAVVQPASAVYTPNIPGMGTVWDSPLLGDAPVAVRSSATLPPYMSSDMPAFMPSMPATSMSSAPFTSQTPDSPGTTQDPQDGPDGPDGPDGSTDAPAYSALPSFAPLAASSGHSSSRKVWLIIIGIVIVAIALGLAYVYMRKRRGGGGSLMFL
jgi:hypothetical protein